MKGHHGHTKKHAGTGKHLGTGKHRPHQSAKQIAAEKKWQQSGTHARHLHAVAKHEQHPKPAKWSPHADIALCSIEALAATLRLTGRSVDDTDVLDLYYHVTDDPDAGMTIEAAIDAAAEYGLAGHRPLSARPVDRLADGVVLGVDLAQRHALTVERHGVWTWGLWRPASCGLLAAADEAWAIDWPELVG